MKLGADDSSRELERSMHGLLQGLVGPWFFPCKCETWVDPPLRDVRDGAWLVKVVTRVRANDMAGSGRCMIMNTVMIMIIIIV